MSGAGHCLCGAARFAFEGDPLWSGHCHCETCRRATSSPMTSFLCVPDDRLVWTGALATYVSSPGVERLFCGRCGSPMAYRNARRPGQTDLFAASLDDPAAFEPTRHFFYGERLAWLHFADNLTKHEKGG